jgi:hypothetical protein
VTIIGMAPSEAAAQKAIQDAPAFVQTQKFNNGKLSFHCDGKRCYFNWKPSGDIGAGAKIMTEWMAQRKFEKFAYQLESGPEITLPPVPAK